MATDKYDLHTIDYSVQGWDTIMATDMEILDDEVNTRILCTLGETVALIDALYLNPDGKYYKAQADGTKQPAMGLAVETGILDDSIRIQRVGPISNAGWAWGTVGASVYLSSAVAGGLTASEPASNSQIIGTVLSATEIFIDLDTRATSSGGGGTSVHSDLSNLAYADSGHTGFATSGVDATITSMTGLDDNGIPVAKVDGALANLSEDADPDLGGQLGVGEYDVKFDSLLSADGKYSGETCDGILGDTLVYGDLVYLNTTDQRWEKTDADAETTSGDVDLAIVLVGGSDGDTRLLFKKGHIREDDWDFTSYGKPIYVSEASGDMTQTVVSGTGDIVRVVGYASTFADQIYFNPSRTWLEVA